MAGEAMIAQVLIALVVWHGECPIALAKALREAQEVKPCTSP